MRIYTHERNRSSLIEIEERWSVDDLAETHLAYNMLDDLQSKAHEEGARRRARR